MDIYRGNKHRYISVYENNSNVDSINFSFMLILIGVTRQVGDALLLERSQRQGRVVSIGIAPWGILDKSHELIGRGGEVSYDCVSSPW